MTTKYILDLEFKDYIFEESDIKFKEYENCQFINCDFTKCEFLAITFIDCIFNHCNFKGAKINYAALRTVTFNDCKIEDVNFAMCDKLIFEVAFNNCVLDFSKFYTLKLKGTSFVKCSLIAVDFMSADLTEAVFDSCDLYRSEFDKAIAIKTNFKTSYNYTINPERTKIKKAIFSLEGAKGLLAKHQLLFS